MVQLHCLFALVFSISFGAHDKKEVRAYIEQHKNIAISEMERTGIPASIKLAQALLESSYGSSELAIKANNHFGIKCGSTWKGDTYSLEDDDYVDGKLIKSCFRKYNSAYESFIAHSEFLSDNRKAYRYGFLFRYKSNDYTSWAYGLYDAGYATDLKYPEKLISIIEKYQLYIFDGSTAVAKVKPPVVNGSVNSSEKHKSRKESTPEDLEQPDIISPAKITANVEAKKYRKKEINETSLIEAAQHETLLSFAKKHSLKVDKLMEYNERFSNSAEVLNPGEYIYVEQKKNNFEGSKKLHRVKEGENMYMLAQKYGIKLKSLYAKNRIPLDSEPLPGQKISLQGKIKLGDRPEFIKKEELEKSSDKFLF